MSEKKQGVSLDRKFACDRCARRFYTEEARAQHARDTHDLPLADEPDWSAECEVCGASPCVPLTGMCGPCTFGEADTIGGNW